MITWLRYNWNEQPTLEKISKALAPHGLVVKSFDNGAEYEFVICTPDTTNNQIIDTIIENFDSEDETPEELRQSLLSFIKEPE